MQLTDAHLYTVNTMVSKHNGHGAAGDVLVGGGW